MKGESLESVSSPPLTPHCSVNNGLLDSDDFGGQPRRFGKLPSAKLPQVLHAMMVCVHSLAMAVIDTINIET